MAKSHYSMKKRKKELAWEKIVSCVSENMARMQMFHCFRFSAIDYQ
jgi:hypothetical protein